MLFNIRWGSLRVKIIAWFLAPALFITVIFAILAYPTLRSVPGWRLIAGLLLIGLAAPAVVIAIGVKKIALPLSNLTEAAREIAGGNFSRRVRANTGDEIEELAEQFNRMAAQLETAHTHLEQLVAERTRELETLNTISEVVSCSLAIDEVLSSGLQVIFDRLGFEAGAVFLLEGNTLALRLQRGFAAEAAAQLGWLACEQGAPNISQPKAQVITHSLAQEDMAAWLDRTGLKTLLCVPLSHHDVTLGTLVLADQAERAVSEKQGELFLAVGQQIGIALENARLYEQARQEIERRTQAEEDLLQAKQALEQQNRELTLLNRVLTVTTSDQEPKAILTSICTELAQAFGLQQCAAALLEEDGKSLTVVAECLPPGGVSAMGVVIPVEENPATLYVLKQKTSLAMADAQHDILLTPVHEVLRRRGVASLLLLPIIVRGEVIGTIGLDATEPRNFSDEEIDLARRISASAAQALEHARGC